MASNISNYEALRSVPARKPVPRREPVTQKPEVPIQEAKACPLDTIHSGLPWRPAYLRRRILCAFGLLFIGLTITLQILLSISNKNQGLTSASSNLHYLWTFGPTAFLTLIAAFWGRVEYQAKVTAPWFRLYRSKSLSSAHTTLLLDYVSIWQLKAMVSALKNRDIVVAGTVAVSLAFTAMIVLSTGLITLSLTTLQMSVSVDLTSAFMNSVEELKSPSSEAFYTLFGLASNNLTYPYGLSLQFAYQTVNLTATNLGPLNTTVDGFSASLDCEAAEVAVDGFFPIDPLQEVDLNVTLSSNDCAIFLPITFASEAIQLGGSYHFIETFARFQVAGCGNSTAKQEQRIGVFVATVNFTQLSLLNATEETFDAGGPSFLTLLNSTQLICQPTYNISSVDVVQNSTILQSISLSAAARPRTLDGVDAWDIMQAVLDFDTGSGAGKTLSAWSTYNASGMVVYSDDYFSASLMFYNKTLTPADFFDYQVVEEMVTRFYQQFAAILAHTSLTEPVNTPFHGAALVTSNRLWIQPLAAGFTTGLLILSTAIILFFLFFVPKTGFLPRQPGTILALASLFSNKSGRSTLQTFERLGAASQHNMRLHSGPSLYNSWASTTKQLDGSDLVEFEIGGIQQDPLSISHTLLTKPLQDKPTQPIVLQPTFRLLSLLIAIGIIVSLQLTLQKSQGNNGLGEIHGGLYLHYLWTIIPAIVLSLLCILFSAVDFEVKVLTPYVNMLQPTSIERSVTTDLLDGLTPVIILRELRTLNLAAFTATFALLAGSFFTIFTASLFFVQSHPTTTPVKLYTVSSFVNWDSPSVPDNWPASPPVEISLLLWGNISYPAFTYENFAFLGFDLPVNISASMKKEFQDPSQVFVHSTVPALRTSVNCRDYSSDAIDTQIYINASSVSGLTNALQIDIDGEQCLSDTATGHNVLEDLGTAPPIQAVFGYSGSISSRSTGSYGCSAFVYAWGSFNRTTSPPTIIVSAMGCNESIEIVDVDTTFFGPDLDIDFTIPPSPREATARPTDFTYGVGGEAHALYMNQLMSIYSEFNQPASSQFLDEFFAALTTSRWAVPASYLTDISKTPEVQNAINKQYTFVRTQMLNLMQRMPASATNVTLTPSGNATIQLPNDAAISYSASITDPAGQRRLVQDPAATHTLQGLLAAAVIASIISWILMPRTRVLPRSPTDIVSVASLIAGGNLMEFVPEGAAWMRNGELRQRFPASARFWLGWGACERGSGERRFAVWVVGINREKAMNDEGESLISGSD